MASSPAVPSGEIAGDEALLLTALATVIDPEVGIDIVNLGLVQRLGIAPGRVEVDLLMTTPACPLGPMIVGDAEAALAEALPPETDIVVEIVWEPAWSPARMSPSAKAQLGWAG